MTAVTDSGTTAVPLAPDGLIAGTWAIYPAHSTVSFAVRHLMSRVRGTFDDVSGQIVIGPDPSQSSATAVVAMASVRTGNDMRDGHLRSADFFDAERFPLMTFASRAVRPAANSWVLAGELTIRDVTHPVDLEVEFLGTDPAGLREEPRIGFSARESSAAVPSGSPPGSPMAPKSSSPTRSMSSWTSKPSTRPRFPGRDSHEHCDHAQRRAGRALVGNVPLPTAECRQWHIHYMRARRRTDLSNTLVRSSRRCARCGWRRCGCVRRSW